MKKLALLILSVIILSGACPAQATGNGLPGFTSIRDALDSADGYVEIRNHDGYIVLMMEQDGRYFRLASLQDEHAKGLYQSAWAQDDRAAAWEVYDEYAWALPLYIAEELPEAPMSQAELDKLKGKTVRELMDEGFGEEIILSESELAAPVTIKLEYGFYEYEFDVTNIASGYPYLMTVRSGKFSGFSRAAFEIDGQGELSDP